MMNEEIYLQSVEEHKLEFLFRDSVYAIPSDYFPLNETPIIFTPYNTYKLKNNKIKNTFNSLNYYLGYCYSNSENLYNALKKIGIQDRDIKCYVGWLFCGNVLPIHHCWVVYKNKYLLDLSPMLNLEKMYKKCVNMKEDEVRTYFTKEFMFLNKSINSQKGVFGNVKQNYLYIGSECMPRDGKAIYNNLISAYPNHLICNNVDTNGLTDMQRRIYKKLK